MNRVYTSADLSLAYDVSATGSEEFTAMLQTPSGKILDVSVTTSAPNITLTMDKANWPDAIGGTGFIEVRSTTGTTDAVVVSEPIRVMGGVLLDGGQ